MKTINNIKLNQHIFDILLLVFTFLLSFYLKRHHLHITGVYYEFIPSYLGVWFIANILSGKNKLYKKVSETNYLQIFSSFALIQIGLLSLVLFAFKWHDLSRFIILGGISLYFIFDIVYLAWQYLILFSNNKIKYLNAILLFLFESIFLIGTFVFVYYTKRNSLLLPDEYLALFIAIYFLTIFTGILTHRYTISIKSSLLLTIWPFFKAFILTLFSISLLLYITKYYDYSRIIVISFISIYYLLKVVLIGLYYLYQKPKSTDEPEISLFQTSLLPELEEIDATERIKETKYSYRSDSQHVLSISNKLKTIYLKNLPKVFAFLEEILDLNRFDIETSDILRTEDPYNIEVLPDSSLSLFCNLGTSNNFRRLNQYFISVNQKLKTGGVFIGKFEPIETRRNKIYGMYPIYAAHFMYFFDFTWKRVFPKLPVFKKIYFGMTKGKNRVLSKAQGLGRLYFCGFELLGLKLIDNSIYFVVKKVKEPSSDENPSYGPLFKMKRYGKNKKIIYVYKFRTMHPYSEYLQDYVVWKSGYSEIGKPANDFRVTSWGRLLRKYWLDELPQLINVMKGEMTLVGIRPLSGRFLQEYPEDVLNLRFKYKPGCVPPYVAHKKQGVEEYIESERQYLLEKEKHPKITDIKYFFWAIYNILTNKIRSS